MQGPPLTPACLQPQAVSLPEEPSFCKEPEDTPVSLQVPGTQGPHPCFPAAAAARGAEAAGRWL